MPTKVVACVSPSEARRHSPAASWVATAAARPSRRWVVDGEPLRHEARDAAAGDELDAVAPIAERVAALKVGDPFDPDTTIGPLVSAEHHDKVMRYMKLALDSGARHIVGGEVPTGDEFGGDLASGNWVMPAVFADCTDGMEFVTDEVFGPLMSVLVFDTEDEVVERANATPYGLSAGVFSKDFARANRVGNALQAGSVWINDYGTLPASVPFGGYKQSGIGRENGANAIEHYTQVKMIYSSLVPVEQYM